MPRDSGGNYSLPLAAVAAGTVVDPDWANDTLNDVASALTGSLPRDGSVPMTGPLQVVPRGSPLTNDVITNGELDADNLGLRYDLFLSRELKAAELVRSPTSPEVVSFFLEHGHDVAAGVKPQLEAELPKHTHLRMLPGHFMVISQAMGLPKNRGPEAQAYLTQFVEDMKATGVVADAMARHRIEGATLAPLAG